MFTKQMSKSQLIKLYIPLLNVLNIVDDSLSRKEKEDLDLGNPSLDDLDRDAICCRTVKIFA